MFIIINVIASLTILPRLSKILSEMGENIKLARLRRKLAARQVAERAGIGRTTLVEIEKGSPSASLGPLQMPLAYVLYTGPA